MRPDEEVFEIEDAVVVRATDKALLIDAPIFDEEQWVPKSQISNDSEVWTDNPKGNDGTLIVSMWIAEQKGWTDD